VLRKRCGRGALAGYFRSIGGRRLFCAALSGPAAACIVLGWSVVLWWVVRRHGHPTTRGVLLRPQSLGQLAMSGLVVTALAPLAEEIFFRGLLL
jgi:membrane protease YdiL (CAAX protease family)